MRVARSAVLIAVVLLLGAGAGAARADTGAPTGLHGFLLRADEPLRTSFPRTPSFAWNPVPGATGYEFQLSLGGAFRDNSIIFDDSSAKTPVEAPPLTLPWITGDPHSLYARVRALTADGATAWSDSFGFDMAPPAPPAPLPGYPGLLRWTPVEGADGYQVWLIDTKKPPILVKTNVLDEREFYDFHETPSWIGTVRWRIRAIRSDAGGRLNGIPAVTHGEWSPIYVSTNPPFTTGPIKLIGTVSDVFSDGSSSSPAHRLMPAFLWQGDQASDGTSVELFRVYVFTDKECLNTVFQSAVVGSPAYAPRAHGTVTMPTTSDAVLAARSSYLFDGAEPNGYMADGSPLPPATETTSGAAIMTSIPASSGPAAPDTGSGSAPVAAPGGGSSGASVPAPTDPGAPTDLWDTDWPSSGYYWTVIPVAAEAPNALQTAVGATGASAGSSVIPVTSTGGFNIGDVVTIGSGTTAETVSITAVAPGQLTILGKLASNHTGGETVTRSTGTLQYRDLELPQDACAAGRVMRFGKESEPALTSEGDLFATGLSSTGRLTSALHTTAFYGAPLVSWTPALGAWAYEVQYSRTQYPFRPEVDPRSGTTGYMTTGTSTVLPITPDCGKSTCTWWYRVRGFDYSVPGSQQQMSWSDPAALVVARPTFRIVGVTSATKPAKGAARERSVAPSATKVVSGNGFSLSLPSRWQKVTLKDSVVTFAYRDSVKAGGAYANLNVLSGSGRGGRTFDRWSSDLAAQVKAAFGVEPRASVVTLPAGKAVLLSAVEPTAKGSVSMLQWYVDRGANAYVLTFECASSAYARYASMLKTAVGSFRVK